MMSSQPSPKLPKWVFFLTDAVLILTAWYIAYQNRGPLSSTAIFSIVACVIVGAIVGTVPLLLHYERAKNETLDDRQRALEALASTLTTAAEQISIAVQGLHSITELAQKNLKQAEQLPQQFQAKVADLKSQLASAQDEERAELKKELAALRAVDSERLASIADKVQKSAADLTKLEAAAQKSLAAAQSAAGKAPEAVAAATATALAEIEQRLAAVTAATLAAIAEAEAKSAAARQAEIAALAARNSNPPNDPGPPGGIERRKNPARRATDIGLHITPIVPPTAAPFAGNIVAVDPAPSEAPPAATETAPAPAADPAPAPAAAAAPSAPAASAAPAADDTAIEPAPPPAPRATDEPPETDSTPPFTGSGDEPKPAKKRAPRKPKAPDASPSLDLGITEPAVATAADSASAPSSDETGNAPSEPAISSDGATRLLVTAYIGIGNRLFIRGEGPGLSWDKGLPLQFVSIGKWRWESAEATTPVKFKLFKNDETECAALGLQTLESGRQQEVTATF